jgi:hypothetical protein
MMAFDVLAPCVSRVVWQSGEADFGRTHAFNSLHRFRIVGGGVGV